MRKTLAVLVTVAAVGATAITAPAPAEARGWGWGGPGLAFGLAAGAVTAGAIAASRPYYGPYGYYGPRAVYAPGPYGYGGGRYGYGGGPYGYGGGPYGYYGGGPYYRQWQRTLLVRLRSPEADTPGLLFARPKPELAQSSAMANIRLIKHDAVPKCGKL
jgi:hypothetical protein